MANDDDIPNSIIEKTHNTKEHSLRPITWKTTMRKSVDQVTDYSDQLISC